MSGRVHTYQHCGLIMDRDHFIPALRINLTEKFGNRGCFVITELKTIVQGISGVLFFGVGIYLLITKRLIDEKIKKMSATFLIVLGISTALLMTLLQQPRAWQIGITVLYAAASISSLFSGIYNLKFRQRNSKKK